MRLPWLGAMTVLAACHPGSPTTAASRCGGVMHSLTGSQALAFARGLKRGEESAGPDHAPTARFGDGRDRGCVVRSR